MNNNEENQKKVFLFLDDDSFHPEQVRNPRLYYPLINANEIYELMLTCKVEKFTTVEGAQDYIEREGCPNFISFDNDLKRELEGVDLCKWLVEKDMDNPGFIPQDFQFFVHSQNVEAKKRIYNYLNQYLEHRDNEIKNASTKMKY
jgi:hypothetical protein